jgi:hypothetical protein
MTARPRSATEDTHVRVVAQSATHGEDASATPFAGALAFLCGDWHEAPPGH